MIGDSAPAPVQPSFVPLEAPAAATPPIVVPTLPHRRANTDGDYWAAALQEKKAPQPGTEGIGRVALMNSEEDLPGLEAVAAGIKVGYVRPALVAAVLSERAAGIENDPQTVWGAMQQAAQGHLERRAKEATETVSLTERVRGARQTAPQMAGETTVTGPQATTIRSHRRTGAGGHRRQNSVQLALRSIIHPQRSMPVQVEPIGRHRPAGLLSRALVVVQRRSTPGRHAQA